MADFFEVDFLDVESDKSGDAITIRYELSGAQYIHVVDGGFQATGESLERHIRKYYGNPRRIDHVVATHPDSDHAGGLRTILENFEVGALWMLRPWNYASELIGRFQNYTSVERLASHMKECHPNFAALEEIATRRKIPILDPFQGVTIGAFRVLAPSRARYLQLVVNSEKTPAVKGVQNEAGSLFKEMMRVAARAAVFIKAAWGAEAFSSEDVSAENEMSVVQFASLCGKRILLTADAGRGTLSEAADYAPLAGLSLPGVDRFQVPHHGSRRNVSTELLDRILGPRLAQPPTPGQEHFHTFISSAKKDTAHPRKAVVRAMIHRGGSVAATESQSIRTQVNAPARVGWHALTPMPYPDEQEDE